MEILALHPGALGDIILSLPALNLLKAHHAGSRITLAGNLDYLAVVPRSCAGRCVSLSTLPLQRLYGAPPIPGCDADLWRSFDRIVSWTGHACDQFSQNLRAVHPNALVAPWKPGCGEQRHVARIFCDTLSAWIPTREVLPSIDIGICMADRQRAEMWFLDQAGSSDPITAALHPGGGSPWKRWPLDSYVKLGRRLLQEGIEKLLIIEGPAEIGLGSELARNLYASSSIVASCLPLNRLAAVMARCAAYVGNDSGISHLAAALGIPSVVIFGPTSPRQWAPLGRSVTVLRDASTCRSCERGGAGGHDCLARISPDLVSQAVRRVGLGAPNGCADS